MNPKDLNQSDQDELNRILALNPGQLSPEEVNTLYARREYLNKNQASDFSSIIKTKDQEVEAAAKGEVETPTEDTNEVEEPKA